MNDISRSRAPTLLLRRYAQAIRLVSLLIASIILTWFIYPFLPIWIVAVWAVGNMGAWFWELAATYRRNHQLAPPDSGIFQRRHNLRSWVFASVITLNFALLFNLTQVNSDQIITIILLATGYSLLAFAWLAYEALRWSRRGQNRYLWLGLSVAFAVLVFIGMQNNSGQTFLSGAVALFYGLVAGIVYLMQRLGVEDRVQNDMLRSLIVEILGMGKTRTEWDMIVKQIEDRMRYDRVFILEPSLDRAALEVVAEAGNYPSVLKRMIPMEQGITGKVFESGKVEAWNDVRRCPFYYRLVDGKLDDTRAEIAVPIRHLGITYGILDVQARHPGVFRWDDVYTLEVIAQILGVAISAEKTDLLVQQAYDLWEELSSQDYSEEAMFQEFACFAEEKLGADVVTYYPLSPTGYPINPPFFHGNLFSPERMDSGIQDPRSPLVQLIREWKPNFATRVFPDSTFARLVKKDPPSFTIRENIESVCFIPVGTRKEYLGAMFLNFRKLRAFDGLFRFMVLSLSQTFAILASRERYKSILFEGFGRPELGVHNLFSRYGLKTGVSEEGEKLFLQSCILQKPVSFTECGISPLLQRVDEFLRALSLVQSSIPPLFLNESLADEIGNFTSTLPAGQSGRRPSTQIEIDPRVERESPWSKLALYRLITESMNNAVFHGGTDDIRILVQRKNDELLVKISNGGTPLPGDSEFRRSKRGIYALLGDLELKFGARTSIGPGPNQAGTTVEANLPALPLIYEA